ncbi:isocitrate dehydrogenase [Marinobacter sp. ELB17]|nr:isocitrate dehydrogenase [Marinobacter sp. ELB17]
MLFHHQLVTLLYRQAMMAKLMFTDGFSQLFH